MFDNIEKVMERGERLELLIEKSTDLKNSAYKFHRQSKKLSCAMWCVKMRFYCFALVVVIILVYTVFAFLCDPALEKCFGHHQRNETASPTLPPSHFPSYFLSAVKIAAG